MLVASVVIPFLLSIPLHAENGESGTVVIIHQGQAYTAPEGLIQVRGFTADGRGGFIGAAQTAGKKWGYINERGQWIVPPNLEDARVFTADGLARFQQDGRWGYVNISGEVVIHPQFEDTLAFAQGLAAVKVEGNQRRFIDRSGKFAFDKAFVGASGFSEAGLAPAVESLKRMLCGYIDRTGKWAIEPRFKSSLAFSAEGVAPASLDGRKYGIIDRKGNWVLKPTYPSIREFNDEGLAYFHGENSWKDGHGYLNTKGQVVVKGGVSLSDHMASGVVYAGSASDGYLTKDGKALSAPRLSFAGPFNSFGYAIVRTADFVWSETLQRHQDAAAQWGILRSDGSFVPAPESFLEPITNAEGGIPAPLPGTPLVPFLTTDRQVVFLDRDGKMPYRIRYENNRVALLDAQGSTLWHSDVIEGCRAPAPFFHRPIEALLDQLDSVGNLARSVESLLAETEEKLHRFAEGRPLDVPKRNADEAEEDEEEEDADEQGEEERAEASVVTARRLVRAYVGEEHNGEYQFLGRLQDKTITAAKENFCKELIARLGAPDSDPEHASSRHRHVQMSAWPFSLKKAIAEDAKPMPEVGQLWVGLFDHSDSGDGDEWDEIWLICAPSLDALDAARRRRSSLVAPSSSAAKTSAAPTPVPQTYEEWCAAVRETKYAISGVPATLIDDAMVDAAIEADVEALEYVLPQWQTPARLEALIRKGASTTASIPPKCMTAKGLALARSLYERDADWRSRDEERSQVPTEWAKNCLYSVWGGILTEKHCIRAVSGGESLQEIPHWLRTPSVEQAAIEADIYNISYIPKEHITPQLAARAVRHDYGKLIEHIPAALITPELCMVSARTNGLSLEQIPFAMRSIDVCLAALRENSSVFPFVPPEIRLEVSTRLIQQDLASAKQEGEDRTASSWHAYRAWLKLKAGDHKGAIDDASLASKQVRYPQTAHYILASAYQALGRKSEASLEASTVLSLENPYKPEFDQDEDTRWLQALSKGQFDNADEATLITQLKSSPRALADVPRSRITEAIVKAALEADPAVIEFVPKRFMTPERYVIALRNRTKVFENIPPAMIREEACIELVRDNGYALERIPESWRTPKVCAYAVRDSSRALEYVPASVRSAAQEAMKSLPPKDQE